MWMSVCVWRVSLHIHLCMCVCVCMCGTVCSKLDYSTIPSHCRAVNVNFSMRVSCEQNVRSQAVLLNLLLPTVQFIVCPHWEMGLSMLRAPLRRLIRLGWQSLLFQSPDECPLHSTCQISWFKAVIEVGEPNYAEYVLCGQENAWFSPETASSEAPSWHERWFLLRLTHCCPEYKCKLSFFSLE